MSPVGPNLPWAFSRDRTGDQPLFQNQLQDNFTALQMGQSGININFGGLLGGGTVITTSTTIDNTHKGTSVVLNDVTNNFIQTLTFGVPSAFDTNFTLLITNVGTRGWYIAQSAVTPFILWPKQSVIVFMQNSLWQSFPSFQRYTKPGASVTIHCDPVSGNDANDGLGTGAGAMATIQAAVDQIYQHVDSGHVVPTVSLADGTYTSGVAVSGAMPGGADQVVITGTVNAIITVGNSGVCVSARDYGIITLLGCTVTSNGTASTGLSATQFGVIDVSGTTLGTFAGGNHCVVSSLGSLNFTGSFNVSGNCGGGVISIGGGQVTLASGISCTITTPITVGFFLVASGSGSSFNINAGFAGFVNFGFVTGQAHLVQVNATAFMAGFTLPGTVAGVPTTGTTVLNASPYGGQVL
jgi:hypothetical protein